MECLFRDKVLKPPSTLAYNFTAKDVKYVSQSPTNIIFLLLLSMACKRRRSIVLEEAHTFWVAVLLSSPPLSRHIVRKALYKYQLHREKKYSEKDTEGVLCDSQGGLDPTNTTVKKVWTSSNIFPLRAWAMCCRAGSELLLFFYIKILFRPGKKPLLWLFTGNVSPAFCASFDKHTYCR